MSAEKPGNISILKDKVILLISPQSWGEMFISKHHYAVELTKKGNCVYFLNPACGTGQLFRRKIDISKSADYPNLFIIDHRLNFPYNIKFHFLFLFHWLMRPHLKKILKKIGREIDIVWSFDLSNSYPFSFFPAKSFKIFHPVDEPSELTAIRAAGGADIIFSVTREILDKYKGFKIPGHFINHGVSDEFLKQEPFIKADNKVRVGYSGNIWRPDIDRKGLLEIIKANPEVLFECWGHFKRNGDSNIDALVDAENETFQFIDKLAQSSNVILHGPVPTNTLAKEFQKMDVFLICYDVLKDQSKGTNYHKVLEYVSTGKIIVANNISTYENEPILVQMVKERDNNDKLPGLFKDVMNAIDIHNSTELKMFRKKYASQNTYEKQLEKIENYISSMADPKSS